MAGEKPRGPPGARAAEREVHGAGYDPRDGVSGENTKLEVDLLCRQDADHVYTPAPQPCTSSMSPGMEMAPKGSGTPKLLREAREGTVAWVSDSDCPHAVSGKRATFPLAP